MKMRTLEDRKRIKGRNKEPHNRRKEGRKEGRNNEWG
jgi:hypothetical protein